MAAKKKGGPPGPFEALRALKDELKKKDEAQKAAPGAPRKAPPPPPVRSTQADPQDEALLLHRLFAGVQPLDRSRGARVPRQRIERSSPIEQQPKQVRDAAQAEADAVHEHLRALVEGRA